MSSEAQATLIYPFESGALALPPRQKSALNLGALPGFRFPKGFEATVTLVQGFRPDFLTLQRAGFTIWSEPNGDGYDLVLILATKHRGENEAMLADAIARVKPGGLVVMAGGKTDGVASLRKRLHKVLPLGGHLAKNHGEVFWFSSGPEAKAMAVSTETKQAAAPLIDRRFHTAPGMFSYDRVDAGSKLLAAHLPANLKGKAADFCAGWGYLSVALAEQAPGITSIHLFEADHASLGAARKNLAAVAPNIPAAFHWVDLAAEKLTREFDLVVMNPPFHQGRAADPGIGQAMIRAASAALKPGGQLFMVANRGLPYEPALKGGFAQVTEVVDEGGFKVWRARR